MKDREKGKGSFLDDFKALSTKQIVAIVASLIIAIVLQAYGFAEQCMGFLIIAAVLYMVPHVLGVSSVKVKGVLGIVFVVLALLVSTFYSGPNLIAGVEDNIDVDTDDFGNITYDIVDDNVTITIEFHIDNLVSDSVELNHGVVNSVNYRAYSYTAYETTAMVPVSEGSSVYTATVPVTMDKVSGYQITYDKIVAGDGETETVQGGIIFFKDNGAPKSDLWSISLNGLWVYVAFTAVMFFMILIFSAMMRRSVEKTRSKMEADGRLYPQGYGRCKECGAMVLPGEVTCRKCGTYIDVPDELRAQKKDYFVCEECGAEVPKDADVCPKCGVRFDSVENEVVHADGTVDVSEETFECSECGAVVPANATRCPKCGAKFDEDDE